jgi:FO synthase
MEALIGSIGRVAQQRGTEYRTVGNERQVASYNAPELSPVVQTPARKRSRLAVG